MSMMQYGIDLGTTNSCIARLEGQEVRVFQNNDQMNVTPSAVHVLKTGRMIVGKRAYDAVAADPQNVALQFKRWMGQRDVSTFPASGRQMSAEQLSAEVLKSLKEDVRRQIGEDVRHAVVTVPAAFGTVQCEATARAANLAGFEQCALLQEPIAAAVAYGIHPDARDQRWMVFDLGGGTLDIAVISTRDGRLTVVEHGGRNLMGGKDIDRLIVERILWPTLAAAHRLPDAGDRDTYELLYRRLLMKAEQDKIALSTADETVVYFDDLGDDADGQPFDDQMTFRRLDLERLVQPILDKSLQLATETLQRAHWHGADLDRILLVGGPTQMPIFRRALADVIGANVDFSIDPMTVVARGAAIFAATVERTATTAPRSFTGASAGRPVVSLAYEQISADVECPVLGKVEIGANNVIIEVKIDAEGGYWTSGWVPVRDGFFEVPVRLQHGKPNQTFTLSARDQAGRHIEVEPGTLTISHGIALSAPPLPKTISIEVVQPNARVELEPMIRRHTPLPAEAEKVFLSSRPVQVGEWDSCLPIKLWEGEEFHEPDANQWLANLYIRGTHLKRSIPAGTEVRLHIRLDQSRRVTVDVYIPLANAHISDGVYLSDDTAEIEPPSQDVFAETLERLDVVRERILDTAVRDTRDDVAWEELSAVRKELMEIDEEMHADSVVRLIDADWKARVDERFRETRARLSGLEKRLHIDTAKGPSPFDVTDLAESVVLIAEQQGTAAEQHEAEFLRHDLERSLSNGDERGIRKATEDLRGLHFRIVARNPDFWKGLFHELRDPRCRYKNRGEATRWLASGQQAMESDNIDGLKEAIHHLFNLQEPDQAQKIQERALLPGIGPR